MCLERSSLLLYDLLQFMQLKVMPMCWFVLCFLKLLCLVKALLQIPQMNLKLSILRKFVFSIIQINSVCMDNYRLKYLKKSLLLILCMVVVFSLSSR